MTLTIYNLLGQQIKTLVTGEFRLAGQYQSRWDGRDELGQVVSSGVYVYQLIAGNFVASRKLVVMK